MTPFELGYAAFLAGSKREENPFDKEGSPHSLKRWIEGWNKARQEKREFWK